MTLVEFNGKQYELPRVAKFNEVFSKRHTEESKRGVELYILQFEPVEHNVGMHLVYDKKGGKILGLLRGKEIEKISGDDAGHLEAIVTHYIDNRIITFYR